MQTALAALVACVAGAITWPASAASTQYQCKDAAGKPVFNNTGCPNSAPSAAELAASAAAAHLLEMEKVKQEAAARADRQLLQRFPDRAALDDAKTAGLAQVLTSIRAAVRRYDDLRSARLALDTEAEFYQRGPMPSALRDKLRASDGSFFGLVDTFHGLEADVHAIAARDAGDRYRLMQLWAGKAPGSTDALPADASEARRP